MPVIDFEGKNTEEAIEKACNQLHISKDELKFDIISTGSSGIFGLGGKKASIRVHIEEKISPRRTEPQPALNSGPPPQPERPARPERAPAFDRPDRSEARPRPRPQPQAPERPIPFKREPSRMPEEPAIQRPRITQPETAAEPQARNLPATVAGPGEAFYQGPDDEAMTKARGSLEGILSHMSFEARIKVTRIEDRIILSIEGENSGLLIGKKGATLDALQFLVNKIVNREREEKFRVIVDTEQYRERRHQSLIDLAQRMADKARRTRRPVTISQLSAHDRRIVHLTLQDKSGLKTRSRGDGPLKNVIIIPGSKRPGGRREDSRRDQGMDVQTGSGDESRSLAENQAFEDEE